jgi:hypothetical protein
VYRTKIAGAYDEFPRKSSYSLFAVWIHAGVAGSGHYWAYIRAGKRKRPAAAAPPTEVETGTTSRERHFGLLLSHRLTRMDDVMAAAETKGKEPMQEVTADTEPADSTAATKELEMTDKEEEKEWLKFNDILVTEVRASVCPLHSVDWQRC